MASESISKQVEHCTCHNMKLYRLDISKAQSCQTSENVEIRACYPLQAKFEKLLAHF